ncbi:membrane dipeptidase [Cystobacter fuscus]
MSFRMGQDLNFETRAAITVYEVTHGARYPGGYALNAPGLGHINRKGLTPVGEAFLREAMRQGFILDVDHMSTHCTNAALALAEGSGYPVVASHCAFRDQSLEPHETSIKGKRAHEGMKTREQARRILELGGMLAPITNQHELKDFPGSSVANDCARSSKTWAQSYQYAVSLLREVGRGGVAMGTDFNGLNQQPGPRYGPHAAHGLVDDTLRVKRRRQQQIAQLNAPPALHGQHVPHGRALRALAGRLARVRLQHRWPRPHRARAGPHPGPRPRGHEGRAARSALLLGRGLPAHVGSLRGTGRGARGRGAAGRLHPPALLIPSGQPPAGPTRGSAPVAVRQPLPLECGPLRPPFFTEGKSRLHSKS